MFVSSVVVEEILETPDAIHRQRLLEVIPTYNLLLLDFVPVIDEVKQLARRYLDAGIVPEKNARDALHVAITTVFEFDVLLSWNFRHLANINEEVRFLTVNLAQGYTKPFKIATPYAVCP